MYLILLARCLTVCMLCMCMLMIVYHNSLISAIRQLKRVSKIRRMTPAPSHRRSSDARPSTVTQPAEPCNVHNRTARHPNDGVWFNFTSESFQFYAYTALYDDRPSLHSTPLIRIIAITTKLEDVSSRHVSVSLYCRFFYEHQSSTRIVAMDREPKSIGYGWPLNKETVKEYIYTCPLSNSTTIPIAVAVLRSQQEDPDTFVRSCMPVELPRKPTNTSQFAVCVPVAFDTVPAGRLIEWLEMHRLLGVSLVAVYSHHVLEPALEVLRRYAQEGFVDLRFSNYIADGNEQHWLHSTPAVNDCIYRYMYTFTYILVIDLDELIIPDNFTSLFELIQFLKANQTSRDQPVNYEFRNSYFFLDIPDNSTTQMSTNLTLLKHRKKVQLSPSGYSIKSIIDPQACIHMHNHYCWGVTSGYQSRTMSLEVDSSIATNRHYKRCHFSKQECDAMMKNVTNDDIMLRFAVKLKQLVNDKITSNFAHLF